MKVQVTRHGNVGVVSLAGEMDQVNLPSCSAAVKGLLDAGVSRLVFDLSGIRFVDSMGAAYLLMTCKRARAQGGDVVLCSLPPVVRKTFDVLGMLDVFREYSGVEAAVMGSR